MVRQRSLFDVVGPVMIGPSSSHTAGAVRLGALARAVFGEQPECARIGLHGSFASTGQGHGTDVALVAGLLGFAPDDARIRHAFDAAKDASLEVSFTEVDLGEAHPNTARFELTGPGGRTATIVGSSLGGGTVVVTAIDDFEVQANGELPMLVIEHLDRPGEIAAVTRLLAESGANIAEMRVSRESRGARALMLIETDSPVDDATADALAGLPGVTGVRQVPAV